MLVAFLALEGLFIESVAFVGEKGDARVLKQSAGNGVQGEIVPTESQGLQSRTRTQVLGDSSDLQGRQRERDATVQRGSHSIVGEVQFIDLQHLNLIGNLGDLVGREIQQLQIGQSENRVGNRGEVIVRESQLT